jgi:drug/metabolite transporter (DMT)-like permease
MLATIGWAIGSLYGSTAPVAKGLFLSAGMQMLAGGFVLLIVSFVTGEWAGFRSAEVSPASLLALAYLIIAGAIVAFTAYSWLIQNASPTAVSTYAYVNPAIAVLLGWLIAGEPLTPRMLLGAAAIVGSVTLISLSRRKSGSRKPSEESGESYDEDELHCTASA